LSAGWSCVSIAPPPPNFRFFLAMPTMIGAFVHDLLEVPLALAPERAVEIGIGFITAFAAAVLVVRPFLRYVARSGFAPFAWYRIGAGVLILVAMWAQWL
jgi:undecaprenyl-diphosphatase